jgi:hypothetical protein
MFCQEKQNLQNECATAWESYEAAVQAAGLTIDPKSGIPVSPRVQLMQSGPALQGAFRLRLEHSEASHVLSKHLSTHRC